MSLPAPLARLAFGLLLFFSVTAVAVAQPKLTASLDRETITLGEVATLTLTFEGAEPSQPPPIAAPTDLAIEYSGKSSHMLFENGRVSASLKLAYRIIPKRAGEFAIPAIRMTVNGQVVASQPLKLRVVQQGGAQAQAASGLARYAFLKLIVPKTTLFQGEVLPLEIQLYAATRGEQLQIPQLQSEGFSFSQVLSMPQNQNPSRVQVGNSIYSVLVFKAAATAVKAGRLTLGPAQCTLVLHIPTGRRARDPLEEFFDFNSGAQRQQVTLISEPVELEVLPLPAENRPPDFTGAVGSYEWSISASPTNVVTGDPITLRIRLSGQGALDGLSPRAQDWHEFKSYPPTSKTDPVDQLGISGVKTFEQVIVPQNSEVKEIPELRFSFFDPDKKSYRTLVQPAVPITVKPSAAQAEPAVLAGAGQPQEASGTPRGLAHIKPYLGQAAPLSRPLLQTPWFLALQAVPIAAWLGAFAWRKRQDALDRNPRRRRRAAVAESIRAGLRELKQHADANRGAEFFALAFRLLQEALGERLDLPASAITESVLDERLRPLGAEEDLLTRLHQLFQACNQARYAGSIGSEELNSFKAGIERALGELQKLEVRDAR